MLGLDGERRTSRFSAVTTLCTQARGGGHPLLSQYGGGNRRFRF